MPNSTQPTPREYDTLEHHLLSLWVDASDTGLCVIDDTSRVVMLNQAAGQMLARNGAQQLNRPLQTVFRGLDGGQSLLQWLGTPGFDGERQVSYQSEAGVRQLLLKPQTVRTATGERFKVIAMTDVTQLVAAQKTLGQQQRQWQALNAGVVLSDARAPDCPIVYVNPVFEAMSGYSASEIVGRNCRFLQGSDLDQPGLACIRDAIKNRTNGYALLRNYRKDGSQFLNELFVSPVNDELGVLSHFIGIQHLRANGTQAATLP